MKYFLVVFLAIFVFSCGEEPQKKPDPFQAVYKTKLKKLEESPQFIVDKIELYYLKKGLNNNEASTLIAKIPKKYKNIIATFNILFSIEEPKDLKLDKRLLSILLRFQDSPHIQAFIAKNYHNAIDKSGAKAFYTLYALNYPFTEEDYENYLKVDEVAKFIKLSFILKEVDHCKEDACSDNFLDQDKFIHYLNHLLYAQVDRDNKKIYAKYKDMLKHMKALKKEIYKLYKRNKKLKRRRKLEDSHEEELNAKKEELKYLSSKTIPAFKTYFYFHAKERRLPRGINVSEILENFLINKTPLNKKILYFLYKNLRKQPFCLRILYYQYIKDSGMKLTKYQTKKLNQLKYAKGQYLLKYGFYKRFYPEFFKKLPVKHYLKSNFLHTVVKDFDWYFLENLRKDTCEPRCNIKNLIYFQYAPELIMDQKDALFNKFTKDKIGNYKISGNESLLYNYLKILLKSNKQLTQEQYNTLKEIQVVYIQELLKFIQ